MSPLEIRLIAYGLLAIILMGSSGYAGHKLTAMHYQAIIAEDKHAQDIALQEAQRDVIAAQQAQATAVQASEKKYEDLKGSYDAISTQLADSVRAYAGLRSGVMSATSTAASAADAASRSAQSASELAGLVQQASTACLNDSARLTALQTWAQSLSIQNGVEK